MRGRCRSTEAEPVQPTFRRLAGGLTWKCFSFMSMFSMYFRFHHACASALLMLQAASHTEEQNQYFITQVHHDAHRVFITLATYTSGREVEVQRNRSRKKG
jgi:hypothetical protein